MTKYNYVTKTILGKSVVFVTRGRAKPFSEEEILDFIADNTVWDVKDKEDFSVPSSKVFSQDLRAGLDFCSQKYGVSIQAIKDKAAQVFPHLTIDQLT